MVDFNKIASVALPIAGGVAGGVIAGPAGIGLGASAGQLAATAFNTATTKAPTMPGASGAEKGMAAMQRNLAEQAYGQFGLSSGEVSMMEDVTFRQNMRNINLLNEFNSIYNVDPAAQQMMANAMVNQIRNEGKDIRKEIALMDADAIRQSYERASTLAARASAQEAEIRKQEQMQYIAEQEFYKNQAQALTQSILGFAEAAAGYAEYYDAANEAQANTDAALAKEVVADTERMRASQEMRKTLKAPAAKTSTIESDLDALVKQNDYRGVIAYLDKKGLPRTYGGYLDSQDIQDYRYQELKNEEVDVEEAKFNKFMGF